ncbi:MAG: prepilin-type N-terminal cleavage/methylation domain-containing protein [Nitrospirae bacterium]|nr:prepilin-type N-terminal cleavage/methylation domain-containing protein [Nitrospirota bacterium]
MKDYKGFTMIELLVVLVIAAIIITLAVSQFTGSKTKTQIESDTKKMYSDLMEIKSKAFSERKTYGLSWSNPASISGYELMVDKNNNESIMDTGTDSVVRTVTLNSTTINKETKNNLTFGIKGSFDSGAYGNIDATFYSECKACDHTTAGCDPEDPSNTLCKTYDTTSDCSDVEYPEYSCIVVTLTRIKMGKWCNNVCQLR